MHHDTGKPATRSELRSFGLIMAGIIALVFGLLLPWWLERAFPWWPWLLALPFATAATLYPPALAVVFRVWMKIGAILGWINTRLLLGVLYFLVVLPIGLLARLFHDPMARRRDPEAPTYRRLSVQPAANNLERPF